MSTKSFVWTLVYCMVGGGIIGSLAGLAFGYGLPDAFPACDPFRHSPVNSGIVYGLAFGLSLGMVVGMFYIWWKSWAIKNMIHRWSISEDPEGNWIEWRPGCVHIVGTVLLVPIALFAVVSIWVRSIVERIPLSAYPEKDGLVIRFEGFQPITVVGAYRTDRPSHTYRFKYPRLYYNKSTCHSRETVPWQQLMPMVEGDGTPSDSSSDWELLYIKCGDTGNR